jgi:predicted peptidase
MQRVIKATGMVALALGVVCFQGRQTCAAEAAPGKQIAQQFIFKAGGGDDAKDVIIKYWLFLPADYKKDGSTPLMLFLHGAGERGNNLELVKKWGPPKLVAKDPKFQFLVVSPQCPKGERWDVEQMVALVKHVAATHRVDRQRMYCTGLSMGGYGTWAITAKYPKLFAAAVPICGGGDPANATALAKLPIWAFHGDKDTSVPLERSQVMVDAIREAGGDAKLEIYPGVGHNSWSQTYANPELYRWLLSHQKQ